jgi:peptide/nickel transport system substrate-binding protein
MRLSVRARAPRLIAAFGLAATLVLPAAAPTAAATEVLRIGTTQDLDSLNPFQTAYLVGYEIFTLNYDMLVGFGPNNETVPGYAASWTQSSDGLQWTFKMHPGNTWSDGQPATAEDARWTLQYYLDAQKAGKSLGYGYLDPYVLNAAITKVEAPDDNTLVVTTSRPNDRILQMYLPILPEHIWKGVTIDKLADFQNSAPVVGSGPYQVQEWKKGESARLFRNDKYWGPKGAADQIVFQFFPDAVNSMVTAFQNGELDYIRNPTPEQFNLLKKEPNTVAINAAGNSFDQVNFNAYDKDIPDGGASTKALRDPAFRAALGYAIDRNALIQRVLGGYGTAGTTQVPASQRAWHQDPNDIRQFDLTVAGQKLDEAGYPIKDGVRYDKEGKPLDLSLQYPASDPSYPKVAQFIVDWFGQIGIKVTPRSVDDDTLTTTEYLDSSIPAKGQLKYDMVIWGWVGDPDPNSLLQILTTSAIGDSSDSQWSNAQYDQLYTQQNEAATADARKQLMGQMQQLFYDQAPYQILYYADELHVYHTNRFSNWQTQPVDGGTPFFVNGSINYTTLQLAGAVAPSASAGAPSAGASAPAASALPSEAAVASAAPSAGTGTDNGSTTSGGSSTLLIVGIAAVIVAIGAVFVLSRRRRATVEDE